jgi:dihydroflavonol-4-reductase
MTRSLVIGASGFLGSHVVKRLFARGDDVRVLLRTTSSTRAIAGLPITTFYGDIFDTDALRSAMSGCDEVYYCVVEPRSWLRDPAPIFRTNVDGLRTVVDVACETAVGRFVFTSSIATISGDAAGPPQSEDSRFDRFHDCGPYVLSRVLAETVILDAVHRRGLPAVILCVANTYGAGDYQPTPHGAIVAAIASGRMPCYLSGITTEVVGIADAAEAFLLAAEKGRIGERYIISERFMSSKDLYAVAAQAGGRRPPSVGIPRWILYSLGFVGEVCANVLRRDVMLTRESVRLNHTLPPLDHRKAVEELGWKPRPVTEAIREAVEFYQNTATEPAAGPLSANSIRRGSHQ